MTDFHNVKVTLHSRDGDYCLQWETTEARYHVWVTRDWFLRRGVGLRAPTLYKKPHNDNPHGRISRLDATEHRIVDDVFHHARSAGLFTAAREKSEAQAANRAGPPLHRRTYRGS